MNEYVQDKVNGPGLGLLVVGILGILLNLGYGGYNLVFGLILPLTQGADFATLLGASVAVLIQALIFLLSVVGSIIIAIAGTRMRAVRSPGLVYLGSILAIVGCCGSGACWCLGLPVGIWAIITMQDDQVKAAFTE